MNEDWYCFVMMSVPSRSERVLKTRQITTDAKTAQFSTQQRLVIQHQNQIRGKMAPTSQIVSLKRTRHDTTEVDKENQPLKKRPKVPPILHSQVICPPSNIIHPFNQNLNEVPSKKPVVRNTRIVPKDALIDLESPAKDPRIDAANYNRRTKSTVKLKLLKYEGPIQFGAYIGVKTRPDTKFIFPVKFFKYNPKNPESPEENFETPNPYDINDDRKEYKPVHEDISFEEYMMSQQMMHQFVYRIPFGDEGIKKCIRTFDAYKKLISNTRYKRHGHFVQSEIPR